ncbi:restriction endonuclease subunit S [Haemophilus influenzae]|uniref:restriction endonuclease subunit S n=1 Tax=Haemophilus influenzae TaxID=727 RepID=UPI000E356E39|nr:restriction endonuclease subunit S [Haemophilus influenzae]MCK9647919.1 restriction endonuclease subunit S [Haemophilus influenzae]
MKNNRTFLEKLLDGTEVEWKPLKKVCNFISTGKLNANAMDENGIYPFFTCNEKPYKINNYAFDMEAILISGNGSQVGHLNYFKGKFNAYQRTYVIGEFDNNALVMYLYHYLNFKLRDYITINSKKGSVPYITLPMLEKFEIPIPPLSVQTEIVRILDTLTALTSELTSELILRQKQYEYYREKLLSEEELGKVGFEWKTIDEISKKISSGGTPTTSNNGYYDNGTIPWLRTQEVDFKEIWDTNIKITEDGLNNSSAKWIPANCVIVAMYGATVGKTAINKIPLTTNQACANIEINDKLACYRYIFHYLTSKYEYIKSLGSGSQTNINAQIIKKLKVPVPPIEEQQRIVSILDKFETLTHSITEGLPLAIEQSQKRYEYYRELLLNFS